MSNQTNTAEKILSSLKGLRNHMQPDERPLFAIPAIWDTGESRHSIACDIVLTNRRLFGYYFVSFPRERLFLDALDLPAITTVSLRQKSHEPIFRELLVSDGQRKVYIRAPRPKIEALYQALRSTIETHAPAAEPLIDNEPADAQPAPSAPSRPTPIYGRQEIRRPFENSPLAITLLFVGGIILEIAGVLLWMMTHSSATGLPLCLAGLFSVVVAIMVRRQRTL